MNEKLNKAAEIRRKANRRSLKNEARKAIKANEKLYSAINANDKLPKTIKNANENTFWVNDKLHKIIEKVVKEQN